MSRRGGRAEGEVSKSEHLWGVAGRWKRRENRTELQALTLVLSETLLVVCAAACKLPSGKGSKKRHEIGKCYPAIYGFCSPQGVSECKALPAPGIRGPPGLRLPGLLTPVWRGPSQGDCLLQGEACDPLILWPAFCPGAEKRRAGH